MADPNALGVVPVPATDAVPLGIVEQFFRFMDDGGWVLYVLLGISVLALTLIIVKLIQFWLLRIFSAGFVEPALRAWHDGRAKEALGILSAARNPVARVIEAALQGSAATGNDEELVKDEITRVAGLQLDNLRTGLRSLALIANISPLIGLLGTVLGMIDAFKALQSAGNRVDPSILSGGIWVALLTTAAGLIIAIPAAAAHNWMEGLVYRVQRAMEDAVTRIFTAQITPASRRSGTSASGVEAVRPAE
jgi:biopolymer transport protein ExbB